MTQCGPLKCTEEKFSLAINSRDENYTVHVARKVESRTFWPDQINFKRAYALLF